MEIMLQKMREAQLQEASRKMRAFRARKRREKRRRKEAALAERSRANGSCKEPADQPVIPEAREPPHQVSVPPEQARSEVGTQKDSDSSGEEPVCRLLPEEEQVQHELITPKLTKAQVRRNRFAKPLTREEELARLRRRERQLVHDEISQQWNQRKGGGSGPTAGNRHAGGPVEAGAQRLRESSQETMLIQVYVRQKWQEVPYHSGWKWSKVKRYLKRKFHLKGWRWGFEEGMEGGGWCKKLPEPLVINPKKRYRVVLFE
jgi:hypothetical protein